MAGDDHVIESDVVRIGSTLEKDFAKKLQAKVDAATKGVTGKVKVAADTTGLSADIRAKLAGVKQRFTFKVQLRADTTGFAASVKTELAKFAGSHKEPTYKVKLVADSSSIKAEAGKVAGAAARSLATAGAGDADSSSGLRLLGAAGNARDARHDAESLREAQAFVLALRGKSIKDQLKLIRDGSDQVAAAERAAGERDAKRDLTRVRTLTEKVEQAHDQASTLHVARDSRRVRTEAESKQRAEDQAYSGDATRAVSRVRNLSEVMDRAQEQAEAAEAARRVTRVRTASEAVDRAQEQAGAADAKRNLARVRSDSEVVGRAQEQAEVAEAARRVTRVRTASEAVDRAHLQAGTTELARVRSHGEAMARAEQAAYAESRRLQREATRDAEREATRMAAARRQALSGFKMPQLIDTGGEGIRPINLLRGAVLSLSPVLVAMGSSAVQASTSVAALGSAAVGTGLLIGGLTIAFKGLTNLLALRKTAQAEAATTAANSASTAAQNAQAELAANNRVLDTQQAQIKAEKDLHDARVEAARDLVDLKQKVADLQNQQKDDTLSVAEAQANRNKVYANYFSTALERARADQDVSNAKTKLSDTTLSRKESQQDLTTSVKKGVEKSDKVVAAKGSLRQARERAAEAKLDKANSGVTSTANKTTSATAQLNKKLAASSPALRELYGFIDKNTTKFQGLQNTIQQGVLPGFTTFLKEVMAKPKGGTSTLEFFAKQAADLGSILGKNVGKIGAFTRTPFFRKEFGVIQSNNATSMKIFGDAVQTLLKPLTQIMTAASPLLVGLAKHFGKFATWFADVIDKADKNGSLAKWFKDAGTEAGKWLGIAKNLLTFLGNVFKASMPSGQSLVQRFEDFTGTIAKWSGSSTGQTEIQKFFDFFKNLNYGDIANFFTQAAVFFAGIKAAAFLNAKPINLVIGALISLSASHPEAVGKVFGLVNDALSMVIGQVVAHPDAAATLLGMLTALKFAKTFGIDLKLPVVDGLRKTLVGKFKVLDKFIGGSASTGTMTVHAGVVNVYGPAGAGGAAANAAGGAEAGGAAGLTAASGVALTAAIAALLAYLYGKEGYKAQQNGKGVLDPFKAYVNNPNPKTFLKMMESASPLYFAGYELGNLKDKKTHGDITKHVAHPNSLATLTAPERAREKKAFDAFTATIDPGDPENNLNKNLLDRNKPLQDYIAARNTSVTDAANVIRNQQGDLAATAFLDQQNVKSRSTLSTLLQQMGASKGVADSYATSVFGIRDAVDDSAGSMVKAGTAIDNFGTKVTANGTVLDTTSGKVKVLSSRLDKVNGTYVIKLNTDAGMMTNVFNDLQTAVAYQEILRSGAEPTAAKMKQIKNQISQKNTYATGGPVFGAGTATSDSIPAWLSNGEYVMPARTVRHYGLDTMEALRQHDVPRYATGGPVSLPFPVKLPVGEIQARIAATQAASTGADGSIGDNNVAEVAEAAARAAHATDKQLIAMMSAGIVESHLTNLTRAVDHDSLGFLQQRPSQGWGTPAQLTNVSYAARKFIQAAKRIDKPDLTAGELAADVQRPAKAYRGRYAEQTGNAVAVLNAQAPYLSGYTLGNAVGNLLGGGNGLFGPWPASPALDHGRDSGVWRKIISLVAPTGLDRHSYGSLYQDRRTDNGGWSWHSDGRAVDFGGYNQDKLAQFFEARKAHVLELIHHTDTADYGIRRGQTHDMGHEYGLHKNHLHVAMASGGEVRTRKYDTGGTLPPGYTLAFNGTGKNETIRTHHQEKALSGPIRLDRRDMAILAAHIAGAASPAVHMDGRQVATITNSYNSYLPAGV